LFFEAHGDKRSILLHRPLSPSRIFLAKTLAGVGLYLLALGIPFVCLESWLATPGNIPAPFHWRTSLPWLADILSGLVYYFAGMLVAQRDVRWYGSRGLPLAAAFGCSYLVWIVPESWQALVVIGILGSFVAVAAWGSFLAGGAYAPQPSIARAALALTFLAGLLILSMLGKQLIGQWLDPGIEFHYDLDRQGRVLLEGFKPGLGQVGPVTDLSGQALPALNGQPLVEAPSAFMETPLHDSYRNSGRFYVRCLNDSTPGNERWYYAAPEGRLLGYDKYYHHFLGSFGPDGFTPADQQPPDRFPREIRHRTTTWRALPQKYLAFPSGAYTVDFARRSIQTLATPAAGETIRYVDAWEDLQTKRKGIVVATDQSFRFFTATGASLISVPRAYPREKHGYIYTGPLEEPERYFVWYQTWQMLLEPDDFKTTPGYLCEYDPSGRELTNQTVPPVPFPAVSSVEALFGMVTPMTEASTLVGATRYLRAAARGQGDNRKSVLLRSLEESSYYIPTTARYKVTPNGVLAGYLALMLLSATACAWGCLWLARRSAFPRAACLGWALVGFCFGWVGLALMLAIQEWPARLACPKCGKLRVVTRETCEHCGALHRAPVPDGTEVFEPAADDALIALAAN
jgi:hypothetical protein